MFFFVAVAVLLVQNDIGEPSGTSSGGSGLSAPPATLFRGGEDGCDSSLHASDVAASLEVSDVEKDASAAAAPYFCGPSFALPHTANGAYQHLDDIIEPVRSWACIGDKPTTTGSAGSGAVRVGVLPNTDHGRHSDTKCGLALGFSSDLVFAASSIITCYGSYVLLVDVPCGAASTGCRRCICGSSVDNLDTDRRPSFCNVLLCCRLKPGTV